MNISNKVNLGQRGKITFNSTEYHNGSNADKVETLLDNDINKHTYYGVLVSDNNMSHFEFTIYNESNIWAYGQTYSDGGGRTPGRIDLYKLNKYNEFELFLSNIQTKSNEWYILFNRLVPGTYKIKSHGYSQFTEWYVESLPVYLLYKNNNYYTTTQSIYGPDVENKLVEITNDILNINKWIKKLSSININKYDTYTIIKCNKEVI